MLLQNVRCGPPGSEFYIKKMPKKRGGGRGGGGASPQPLPPKSETILSIECFYKDFMLERRTMSYVPPLFSIF